MEKKSRRAKWVAKRNKFLDVDPRDPYCRIPDVQRGRPVDGAANFARVRPGRTHESEEGYGTVNIVAVNKRTGTDGELLAEAKILPASNEIIDFVELYDDAGGDPGSWVGDLWYETTDDDWEIWKGYDWDIDEMHPVEGQTYHVVCWSSINGYNSASSPAEVSQSKRKST